MIVDGHVHIASDRFLPRSFVDGSLRNIAVALQAQGVPNQLDALHRIYRACVQDHDGDRFVQQMDEAGVDMAVALAPDFTYALQDCPLTVEELSLAHHRIAQRHGGRIVVFGGPDPRWGQDGLDLLERCFTELGFRGYKIYPPCGYSASDPILYPFYELCRAHRAPVLLHTGPTSSVLRFDCARPDTVDRAAMDFPEVDFILAHAGVHDVDRALQLAAFRPNVYLDVSGYAAPVDGSSPAAVIARCLKAKLPHKIIFGTDWPVFAMNRTYTDLVDVVRDEQVVAAAPRRHYQAVVSGNIRRLLGLPREGAVSTAGPQTATP